MYSICPCLFNNHIKDKVKVKTFFLYKNIHNDYFNAFLSATLLSFVHHMRNPWLEIATEGQIVCFCLSCNGRLFQGTQASILPPPTRGDSRRGKLKNVGFALVSGKEEGEESCQNL